MEHFPCHQRDSISRRATSEVEEEASTSAPGRIFDGAARADAEIYTVYGVAGGGFGLKTSAERGFLPDAKVGLPSSWAGLESTSVRRNCEHL